MPVTRNPADITARLNNVIEHLLQGDNVDQALIEARIQATFLLEELDWFLGYTPHPRRAPAAVFWTTRQRPDWTAANWSI